MSSLTLRRYELRDEDAVWDLHVRALDDAGAYDEAFEHLDADLRRIESAYLETGEFLVGERDGDLVAMGGFQPHAERGDAVVLRRMRVDPAHQRRGYGTAVLEELEDRALEAGFDRVVLDTTPRQEAAVAFYEHHGYVRVDEETVEGHEILFYAKRIGDGEPASDERGPNRNP